MSASENLSELQFFAHRGLRIHSGNNFAVNESAVGMHWSTIPAIAEHYSGKNYQPGGATILSASIPISSVETDRTKLKEKGVDTKMYGFEQEVSVKEGAPIYVTKKSTFGWKQRAKVNSANFKSRKRTRVYNPPREMKA